jgi:hypothetical protein
MNAATYCATPLRRAHCFQFGAYRVEGIFSSHADKVDRSRDERFVYAELKRRNVYKGDPLVAKASSPKDGSTR